MEQKPRPDTDAYFAPVERDDYDIQTAMDDPDLTVGRSGTGIVTIGLFGGKHTTDDPDAIEAADDNGRGIGFVRALARAAQDIDDFSGTVRFPREVEDAIYSGSSRTDPFGAYRTTMYLGEMDNRQHQPLMDGLVEYLETDHDGRYDIRAIEFSFDSTDPKEKFRTVFPWAKREHELDTTDALDGYELPAPLKSLVRDLRQTPLDCRDYHRLDITVHYYNHRSDRDGKYDRDFQMDDFYGADEMRLIENDRRTLAEQTLDNTRTTPRNTSISYELALTVSDDEIDALIDDDDHLRISTRDDVARHLAQIRHEQEYTDAARTTVGIVSVEENPDDVSFTLVVQAE